MASIPTISWDNYDELLKQIILNKNYLRDNWETLSNNILRWKLHKGDLLLYPLLYIAVSNNSKELDYINTYF
jgi:hypothetical protein